MHVFKHAAQFGVFWKHVKPASQQVGLLLQLYAHEAVHPAPCPGEGVGPGVTGGGVDHCGGGLVPGAGPSPPRTEQVQGICFPSSPGWTTPGMHVFRHAAQVAVFWKHVKPASQQVGLLLQLYAHEAVHPAAAELRPSSAEEPRRADDRFAELLVLASAAAFTAGAMKAHNPLGSHAISRMRERQAVRGSDTIKSLGSRKAA